VLRFTLPATAQDFASDAAVTDALLSFLLETILKNIKILALALGAAVLAPLAASAQPAYPQMMHHSRGHVFGRIASVNGGSFTLDNGRTVFLHQGTVINPTGRPLHRGERVDVHGRPAGDGSVNANVIDILPRY